MSPEIANIAAIELSEAELDKFAGGLKTINEPEPTYHIQPYPYFGSHPTIPQQIFPCFGSNHIIDSGFHEPTQKLLVDG
ncbi:hypothetical protein H6G64_06185 [Calothrix sp. FACHB-156]|nr:hypothetical protein [Nostoc linckia FACHB-104]MBD2336578.1 hypothetical protein [Calothrix sp. FACHB-156]